MNVYIRVNEVKVNKWLFEFAPGRWQVFVEVSHDYDQMIELGEFGEHVLEINYKVFSGGFVILFAS